MKIKILSIALLSFSTLSAPSNDINYLMNTPLTLWDKGMLQLSEKLSNVSEKSDKLVYRYASCSQNYDFDKNKILITCMSTLLDGKSKNDADLAANQIVDKVRLNLDYYHPAEYSSYEEYYSSRNMKNVLPQHPIINLFRHDDYQLNSEPLQLGENLEKIISINLIIDGYTDGGQYTYCQATLQGPKPLCRDVSKEEYQSDINKLFIKN